MKTCYIVIWFDSNCAYSIFYRLGIVGRGGETQLQVGEKGHNLGLTG